MENTNAYEEKSADATAVFLPKNKEVLYALDIIRRQLQFEGKTIYTFLQLERKGKIAWKIKLNNQQSHSISLEIHLSRYLHVFIYFLSKNKTIALRLL